MKTLANHVLTGTYRPDRHGPLPASLTAPAPAPGRVPAAILAGLGTRGTAFVRACWRSGATWSPPARELLHEAGRLLDALELERGTRAERGTQRLLVATLRAVPIGREALPVPAPAPASRWGAA